MRLPETLKWINKEWRDEKLWTMYCMGQRAGYEEGFNAAVEEMRKTVKSKRRELQWEAMTNGTED